MLMVDRLRHVITPQTCVNSAEVSHWSVRSKTNPTTSHEILYPHQSKRAIILEGKANHLYLSSIIVLGEDES